MLKYIRNYTLKVFHIFNLHILRIFVNCRKLSKKLLLDTKEKMEHCKQYKKKAPKIVEAAKCFHNGIIPYCELLHFVNKNII